MYINGFPTKKIWWNRMVNSTRVSEQWDGFFGKKINIYVYIVIYATTFLKTIVINEQHTTKHSTVLCCQIWLLVCVFLHSFVVIWHLELSQFVLVLGLEVSRTFVCICVLAYKCEQRWCAYTFTYIHGRDGHTYGVNPELSKCVSVLLIKCFSIDLTNVFRQNVDNNLFIGDRI